MKDSNKLNKHIHLQTQYFPNYNSNNINLNFDNKAYFLKASLNKKSLVTPSVLKYYNESIQKKAEDEKKIKKRKWSELLYNHTNNKNKEGVDFYDERKVIKTHLKQIKQEKTKFKFSENSQCKEQDQNTSFDSFVYGFTSKNTANPSLSISFKYLKEKLKYSK